MRKRERSIEDRLRDELGLGPREQLKLPLGEQTDHATTNLHGGEDTPTVRRRSRSKSLPIAPKKLEGGEQLDWLPRPGLPPGGRAECRGAPRPCPYVRCKWHLWFVAAVDRHGGQPRRSTVIAAWVNDEGIVPPSCALDIAESLKPGQTMPFRRLSELLGLGLNYETVERIARNALAKLANSRLVEVDG